MDEMVERMRKISNRRSLNEWENWVDVRAKTILFEFFLENEKEEEGRVWHEHMKQKFPHWILYLCYLWICIFILTFYAYKDDLQIKF